MKKVVGKRRGEILIKCALAAAVGLLLIMLVQSFLENPAEVNAAEPEITLYSKDNKVPVYQAGKEETWIRPYIHGCRRIQQRGCHIQWRGWFRGNRSRERQFNPAGYRNRV